MDDTTKVTATGRELMDLAFILALPDPGDQDPNDFADSEEIIRMLVPDLERPHGISSIRWLCVHVADLRRLRAEREERERIAREELEVLKRKRTAELVDAFMHSTPDNDEDIQF